MACLYCGKEVGPIQLLKGGDFCCASHRVSYHQRLSRALQQISRPEPPPPAAGFLETITPCGATCASIAQKPSFSGSRWRLEFPTDWQISIRPVLGSEPRPSARPAAQARVCRPSAGCLRAKPLEIRPLLISAARPSFEPARASALPGLAPLAVEREVQPQTAAALAAPPVSPEFLVELRQPDPGNRASAPASLSEEKLPLAPAAPSRPAPEAVEREVQPRVAAALAARAQSPEFGIGLLDPEAETRVPAALPVAGDWLTGPAAQAAERELAPREFAVPISLRTVCLPELRIGITGGRLSNSGALRAVPDPRDDRTRRIAYHLANTTPCPPSLAPAASASGERMPALREDPESYPSAGALRPQVLAQPAARETSPLVDSRILRASGPLITAIPTAWETPGLDLVGALATPLAPVESAASAIRPGDSAPRPASLPELGGAQPWGLSVIEPAGSLNLVPPPTEEPENYPVADFLLLEYHPQRTRRSRIAEFAWRKPALALGLPEFALTIPPEDWTALSRPPQPRKPDTPAPVVVMPAPARKPSQWTRLRAAGAIAASLFAGLMTWGGVHAVRVTDGAVINRDVSAPDAHGTARVSNPAGAMASSSNGPAEPPRGPMGWVKAAVASRAAMDLTDSFRGMEAWGMAPKKWAPGWSRHRDGYVRVGQFAIFNPSREYRNYRLEFLAQIENRGFNWAVRARDPQNYYAMKFTVLEAGLRPVIAMVHYPVVRGKAGPRSETPLSVMIHRDEPYRVSVEVKGSRVVTSIEGQEVDSWTDRTLASGGIGFFSEPGERARLYWMKVAVNDDFMGRVCAYFSGGAAPEPKTAMAPPNPAGSYPGRPSAPVAALAVLPVFANRRKQTWVS